MTPDEKLEIYAQADDAEERGDYALARDLRNSVPLDPKVAEGLRRGGSSILQELAASGKNMSLIPRNWYS